MPFFSEKTLPFAEHEKLMNDMEKDEFGWIPLFFYYTDNGWWEAARALWVLQEKEAIVRHCIALQAKDDVQKARENSHETWYDNAKEGA